MTENKISLKNTLTKLLTLLFKNTPCSIIHHGKNCTEINWNLDVPVGIVHRQGDGRPISPSSIPGRRKRIIASPKCLNRQRSPSSLLLKRCEG
jgi:hypothetical protein